MTCKSVNYEFNKEIGGKLLRVRQRAGISQQSVAFDLEFSPTTYSKLENGKIDFTVTRLEQLSRYFGVKITDFLDSSIETPRLLKDVPPPTDYKSKETTELLREMVELLKKS